jgi:hypothetical protein
MKYCNNCKQIVEPQKNYNEMVLIVLLLCCGIVPGIIYYLIKPKACPMCNSTNWGIKPQEEIKPPHEEHKPQIPQNQILFCPECGSPASGQFCATCGRELK